MSKTRDRRFTVSVASELADRVDQYVSKTERANRSEVVEQALRLWESLAKYSNRDQVLQEAMNLYEKQQERELYRAYYADLREAARAEDADWNELSQESAANHWTTNDIHTVHR